MKMNKIVYAAMFAAALTTAASCSDDEPNGGDFVDFTTGVYVVNNGVQTGNVPGGITSYNIEDGTSVLDAFAAANAGTSIGDTPQSAIIHGSKMYIAVTASNLIWVVDANSLRIIKSIKPEAPMTEPRAFAAKDGKVYVSMYSGHVASIDTISMTIDRSIEVGPNPEEIAIAGSTLYCANSDGMNWENSYGNCSLSLVDLDFWTERKIQAGLNPTKVVSNGTDVFVITMGNYSDIPATVKKINGTTVTDVCPGTLMDIRGNELYVIDAPSGSETVSYTVYNMLGNKVRDMVAEGVESPSDITVDPVSGDILILSYHLGSSGWALYSDPCYARLYKNDGTSRASFDTGVGSINAVFCHSAVRK